MQKKIVNITDSYKLSHFKQYPSNTQYIFNYVEARGGEDIIIFGLQAFIQEYLMNPVNENDVEEARELYEAHGCPFNYEGWMNIVRDHSGYLPVEIKAVPEGTVVNAGNVVATVVNTDPAHAWVVGWLETALLRAVWYPSTVATKSRNLKKLILEKLEATGDPASIDFKLHDFGGRGVSSHESAELAGMAHLTQFMGTDTVEALWAARRYYNEPCAGFSIPAAEHSTITSWGRSAEADAFRNMIKQFGNMPLYAVVSDSYDIFNAVQEIWGTELKDEVSNADGTLVIRPDSGDPVETLPKICHILWDKFGGEVNEKGYKVLNPKVRIIQGDGVDYDVIDEVLEELAANGFSADNLNFGMGGNLLQNHQRDDYKWAMKCSAIDRGNGWEDVYKDPITDTSKTSKRGVLDLCYTHEGYKTVRKENNTLRSELEVVYCNGGLVSESDFATIRKRSAVV